MNVKKLGFMTAGLVLTQSALALSLGDISTYSRLGEPLRARISIPSFQTAELDGIDVQLADKNLFQNKGIEWVSTHDYMKFRVNADGSKSAYIDVESSRPVNDLDFSFLIKVNSKGTSIVRRYDVLVGIPGENSGSTDSTETVVSNDKNAVSSTMVSNIMNVAPQSQHVSGMIEYGPVKRGEVLSIIAQKMRGHRKATLQQMMMAIYQQNPDAFNNHNINDLSKGSILRIKDFEQVQNISKRNAVNFVNEHIAAWENEKNSVSSVVSQVASSVLTIEEVNVKELAGLDKAQPINVATDLALGMGDDGKDINTNDLAVLRKELQVTADEAESVEAENGQLSAKIAQLEQQIQQGTMNLFNGQAAQSIITKEPKLFADDIAVANNDIVIIDDGGTDYNSILGVILVSLGLVVLAYLFVQRQRAAIEPEMELVLHPARTERLGWLRWFDRNR